MVQRKLESDLMEGSQTKKRAVPGFEEGSRRRGIEMADVER